MFLVTNQQLTHQSSLSLSANFPGSWGEQAWTCLKAARAASDRTFNSCNGKDQVKLANETTSATNTHASAAQSNGQSVIVKKGKQKKRSAAESFQNVLTNVLDKLIDAQNKSETRLMEFEEKRLKLENEQKLQARNDERE